MAVSRKDRGSPVVKKNDAYTGMLFVSLLAMTGACILLYLDYGKYGDAKPPKEPPPLPGAKAPVERPSAVDKKPKEPSEPSEPKEPMDPANPMPKVLPMPMGGGMLPPAREPATAVRTEDVLPAVRPVGLVIPAAESPKHTSAPLSPVRGNVDLLPPPPPPMSAFK